MLATTPHRRHAMFDQINNPFVNQTRQIADAAIKANALALNSFEQIVNLQMKAFEDRFSATVAFLGEAGEVRDADGFKSLLPKSAQFAKDNAETAYHTSQEIFGQALKAQEAITDLLKNQFEAVNDEFAKAATEAGKPARKAAAAK